MPFFKDTGNPSSRKLCASLATHIPELHIQREQRQLDQLLEWEGAKSLGRGQSTLSLSSAAMGAENRAAFPGVSMYGSRKVPLERGEFAQVTYLKNINAFWKNTANPGYTLVSAEEQRKHSVL